MPAIQPHYALCNEKRKISIDNTILVHLTFLGSIRYRFMIWRYTESHEIIHRYGKYLTIFIRLGNNCDKRNTLYDKT